MSPTAQSADGPPKFKRSARNYLLDTRFQLKYTGYIVGLTLAVGLALGFLLYRQASATVALGDEAVKVGAEANAAAIDSVKQAKALNEILLISGETAYKDDPALLSELRTNADKDNKAIAARAAIVQSQEQKLKDQRVALDHHRKSLVFTLAASLGALVLFIGLAAIVITHRIVGPIFKMKRLLRDVGDGKLSPPGKLRKGDELQDFFEVFALMVDKLRERQLAEVKEVEAALAAAKKVDASGEVIAKLEALRVQMQAALDS